MQIDDLTSGLSLSFIIHLNNEELQFESRILEVYSRRHTLLAEGVFIDDKIISFRGKGLLVDLLVTLPDDKPQLFKNVTTNVVKRADGTLCYNVFSIAGSKTYNRRQSYRCYIGIETAIQCGLNRSAHDVIIKDINRGATLLPAVGMYRGESRNMIYTILTRREMMILRHRIAEIDPEAFINVIDSKEILGRGFKPLKES